ncbi:MAG: cytochrome c oxidase accessory protein CcoG [Methylophilaceae bacterium]|nr:cytochrome c oxidase accessory protein CcoG [Methylophilaceae bacterium]
MSSSSEDTASLYQKHIPIHTRSVKGKFRNFKTAVLVLAYTVYFLLPWLPWHRANGSHQAVLFDLAARRFYLFDLVIYPQDIFLLSLLLFIAATLLFFVTGLVGRAWCGFFCFQTLWTDLFIMIEHWIQGERPARIRLSKQPWGAEKVLKIGGSHVLMIAISFWTAFTFAIYYTDAHQFVIDFLSGNAAQAGYITVLALGFATYLAGGLGREQICIYICPYARFQAVMYEAETLAVSYDARRGEGSKGRVIPIKGLRTQEERHVAGHGDCIDCGFCVQVCPTGIDIRNGLQYQCISCGLCIDACNNIMDSVGYPRGLIRYDSEKNLASAQPEKPQIKWKRLKVVGYAVALLSMIAFMIYTLGTRTAAEVQVQQIRQPLFVELSDGKIRNRYDIHIVNKTEREEVFTIHATGIPEDALSLGHVSEIKARAGKDLTIAAKVDLEHDLAERVHEIKFIITPLSNPQEAIVREVNFSSKQKEHDEKEQDSHD